MSSIAQLPTWAPGERAREGLLHGKVGTPHSRFKRGCGSRVGGTRGPRLASRQLPLLMSSPSGAASQEGAPQTPSAVGSGLATTQYERDVDTWHGSEDQILLSFIGEGHRVLELGCHTGYFSAAVTEQGNTVEAIDIDADAIRVARQRGINATVADLDAPDTLPGDGRFDVVVMANVLEHLRRPAHLLRDATRTVHKDGRLILSVPNVAHLSVRLGLMRGRFDYCRAGIMDETHLHFYTRASLRRLLEQSGWRVTREHASTGRIEPPLRRVLVSSLARVVPTVFAIHLIAEARLVPK